MVPTRHETEVAKRAFAEFRSVFSYLHEEVVELVDEGYTVVGRFRCSGTQRGEFLGIPPTGRRANVEEVFLCGALA